MERHWFLEGAYAGAAAGLVAFFTWYVAHAIHSTHDAPVAIEGLRLLALGLAFGPPLAWITRQLGFPLLPTCMALSLAFGFGLGARHAEQIVPLLAYGVVAGLILRAFRSTSAGDLV